MLKKQFSRFVLVGLVNTANYYFTFLICLKYFSIDYLISAVIAFLISVLLGFFLNKNWTFDNKDGKSKKFVVGYFLVYVVSLIISLILLKIMVEAFSMYPEIANLLVIGVTTCTNFIGTKILVFKR